MMKDSERFDIITVEEESFLNELDFGMFIFQFQFYNLNLKFEVDEVYMGIFLVSIESSDIEI